MASKKIEELDIEDLSFIETLLNDEFNRRDDQIRLTRLRDAIRSQLKFKQLTREKW